MRVLSKDIDIILINFDDFVLRSPVNQNMCFPKNANRYLLIVARVPCDFSSGFAPFTFIKDIFVCKRKDRK